ncbi:MAG: amidohydrolase [Natronomonas sp.]|uniref:amidohydrolase n=1 Tax=Natronomonas sp. TaxID=2184060 RepID=UPI00286FD973|nr:amidohydrolase [Natronomonas sp.]MDR9431681.1 amidohydrolase [Natronomonas sp.]
MLESKSLIEIRRDLHAHPEPGWLEYRTTAIVAAELSRLGFDLAFGSDAMAVEERLGVPDVTEREAALRRARGDGAPQAYLDRLDGITGLVATKRFGNGSGPTVGVRVDMDALERSEASNEDHRPAREGFASRYPGAMHACGHDAHVAIGIGIARELVENGGFDGTLKLFFQPAEEGGRGGLAMSRSAHLDAVNYFFALHVGLGDPVGRVIAAREHPLSNAKICVRFDGEPAHAGKEPQKGKNALQAMATAIQNLYGIPRHADGGTRINVGRVESLNVQNVIPERATMRVEVRGESATLNRYMLDSAERVIDAAAAMHEVSVEQSLFGKATTFEADQAMIDAVSAAAEGVPTVDSVVPRKPLNASEDASYLIERVQENGGVATYVGIGGSNPAGHHTARFDVDEGCLDVGVRVGAETIRLLS